MPAHAQSPQPPSPPVVAVTVDVIGATPLPGLELSLDEIPAPVQTATDRAIQQSGALDLADFLNRRLNGVHVNEVQGNPFQADVSYRGYAASPLLGTPQGVSVYLDGVRANQPFGDVVSWDVIPRVAISSMSLMPGSNPLFGLNTLGGALSLQTKDGRTNPGTTVEATYGSHARRALEFEHGGAHTTGLSWYVAGNIFAEDGWRDRSPSDVRQVFGKIGWLDETTDLKIGAAYANNALTGNGLQDTRLLANDYASVYTTPDDTNNRSASVNATVKHALAPTITLSGNLYYRDLRTSTFNADLNDRSLDQAVYQPTPAERAALAAAGYTGVPASGANADNTPFPFWRCIANALLRDQPGEICNGLLNRSETTQHNGGISGQAAFVSSPRVARGGSNHLTIGGAFDRSRVSFRQSTELGYLNPDRTVTGVGAFGDGVTGGEVDGEPYDARVDLGSVVQTWSAYATDTLAAGGRWHVTASARFNRTSVENRDRISPGGGTGSLDGQYVFQRLNPAAGFTVDLPRALNLYAGYSEGSRAPTAIELGCADPESPCKLPNAMAGDPPLDQIVTRTWEGGVRRGDEGRSRFGWHAGFFHANTLDDVLFVSSSATGFGYFKNFGRTKRQGVDAVASARAGRLTASAGYTFLDATYQSTETVNGTGNSANDLALAGAKGFEGTITIKPGDRLPLVPRHLLKAFADVQATRALAVDVTVVAASSAFARGNENNLHQPDGTYYLGPGTAPGYFVVNVAGRFQLTPRLQLIGQVNNVLDRQYYTAAQLGPTGFTSAGNYIARPLPPTGGAFPVTQGSFYTPGAPATAVVGLHIKL